MDRKSALCSLLIVLGALGCARNGALKDPLIYWDKSDPQDIAKYGPTPTQKRDEIRYLALRSPTMSSTERQKVAIELANLAANETDPILRSEAIDALGAFPTDEAMAGLKSAIYDPDATIRRTAVTAMSKQNSPTAVSILGDVVTRDRDFDVRLAAAEGLGRFDTPESRQALVAAIEDRDPAMRFAGIQSLKKMSPVDYQGDVDKWKQFAQGQTPAAPEFSVADYLVPSFFR
ncbi:MAG: HEAT repeat domain-containing protein [Pirellulaceae bacterium]